MKGIADIMLKGIEKRCKEQLGIALTVNEGCKRAALLIKGMMRNMVQASPLRRTIQNMLEDKMAEEILDGKIRKKSTDRCRSGAAKKEAYFTVKRQLPEEKLEKGKA